MSTWIIIRHSSKKAYEVSWRQAEKGSLDWLTNYKKKKSNSGICNVKHFLLFSTYCFTFTAFSDYTDSSNLSLYLIMVGKLCTPSMRLYFLLSYPQLLICYMSQFCLVFESSVALQKDGMVAFYIFLSALHSRVWFEMRLLGTAAV